MRAGAWARGGLVIGWLALLGLVVYLSLLPQLKLPGAAWNLDKLCHMTAYVGLAALAVFGGGYVRWMRFLIWGLIPLGCLLEWLQSFVPGRSASLGDAAANVVGVFIGIWVGHGLSRLAARWFPPELGKR